MGASSRIDGGGLVKTGALLGGASGRSKTANDPKPFSKATRLDVSGLPKGIRWLALDGRQCHVDPALRYDRQNVNRFTQRTTDVSCVCCNEIGFGRACCSKSPARLDRRSLRRVSRSLRGHGANGRPVSE
jgi:hypothetical protein